MSMQSKRIARKKQKKKPGEPHHITRAVTHIRLRDANAGKLSALDTLAPAYLELCQHYVNLFCTVESPNKLRDPLYPTPLSERWHRVAIMQAAGIAQSWRTNRTCAEQDYQDDLAEYQELLKAYREQQARGTLNAEEQAIKSPKVPIWREWNDPMLREWCIQANVNVAKLEPSEDSSFEYWLTVSTLEKGHPVKIPVKLAEFHREALKEKKLNSGVTLNKRGGSH